MMRGKSMKRMLWLCGFAFLMAHSPCVAASDGLTIKWGRPIDLGPGGYARVHRLANSWGQTPRNARFAGISAILTR